MKRTSQNRSRRRKESGQFLPAIGLAAACLLSFVLAEIPAWWSERGLVKRNPVNLQPVAASDFAAANQGQLKNVAIAAYEEFLARIPAELGGIGADIAPVPGHANDKGSPGWRLRELVSRWVRIDRATGRILRAVLDAQGHPTGAFSVNGTGPRQPASGADTAKDFAAITQGQLKAVAAPFYDRLAEVFWSYNGGIQITSQIDPAWAKPWTDTPNDDNNHAMASLGQLKRTFSLDLHSDADADGLTNLAELLANKQRSSSDHLRWMDLRNPDSDGDGFSDSEEVSSGSDPRDPASKPEPLSLQLAVKLTSAYNEKPGFQQFTLSSQPYKYYLKRHEHYHYEETRAGIPQKKGEYEYTVEIDPAARKATYIGWQTDDTSSFNDGKLTETSHYEYAYGGEPDGKTHAYDLGVWAGNAINLKSHDYRYTYFLDSTKDADDVWTSTSFESTGKVTVNSSIPNPHIPPIWWYGILRNWPENASGWSGNSSYREDNYTGGTLDSWLERNAAVNGAGIWTGTEYGTEHPAGIELNQPWGGGMNVLYEDTWPLVPSYTALKSIGYFYSDEQGDYLYECWGEMSLDKEYTREDLISQALADMPGYPAEWSDASMSTVVASRYLSPGESEFSYVKGTYKLKANACAPQTIVWAEYFHPDDDPLTDEDESLNVSILNIRTWQKTASTACESPPYHLAPLDGKGNGYYTVVLLPFEFTVNNITSGSNIRWGAVGFDPPIAGDPRPGSVRGDVVENDAVDRVWWTSVCRTSTARPAPWMGVDGYPELNTNKSLSVHFGSDAAAAGYDLIVAPGYESLIQIGPPNAPNTNRITALQAQTNFGIKGLDPAATHGERATAEIWLVPKGLQPPQPSATLKVAVLPEVRLTIGIYFAQDNASQATKIWNAANLARLKKNEVLFRICSYYQQACITFVPAPADTNVQAATNATFDTNKDGSVDSTQTNQGGEYNLLITALISAALPQTTDVSVAFVKGIIASQGTAQGYSPLRQRLSLVTCGNLFINDGVPRDADEVNQFLMWSAAHEIGHVFDLSTRKIPNTGDLESPHDRGPFPEWLNIHNSLMTDGTTMDTLELDINKGAGAKRAAWLRHEDWFLANKTANGLKH